VGIVKNKMLFFRIAKKGQRYLEKSKKHSVAKKKIQRHVQIDTQSVIINIISV
jgi:hypothetical protein